MVQLDMETSVVFVENTINGTDNGFFIYTDFGKIGIESSPKDCDVFASVIVNPWQTAPATKWAMKHSHAKCDFHVIIEKGKTKFTTHLRVIEALSRCMLMHIFEDPISVDVANAAVKVYLTDIDRKTTTINAMEKEWATNELNLMSRNDPAVLEILRELITRRDIESTRIIEVGQKLSTSFRNGWNPELIYRFSEGYYRDILYVILYVAETTSKSISLYVNIVDNGIIDIGPANIIRDQGRILPNYMYALIE